MKNSLFTGLVLICYLGCSSRNNTSSFDNESYRTAETAVYSDLLSEIDWFAKSTKQRDSLTNFIFFLETDTLASIESDESDSISLTLSHLDSRILDREQFNLSYPNKIILSKTHLKKQQLIAETKKYQDYKKDHLSTPNSYRFSRVLFNSELNAGILSYSCNYNCSETCRIAVEKSGNTWRIKKKLICSPPF